jgi:hypothetical protein
MDNVLNKFLKDSIYKTNNNNKNNSMHRTQ